eukprot:TRINITY_DN75354_c0_g1_i1.p1 TRINITY_DN75354_c0_g1~~TRINITY_DN75354_c0_g1_i1.p1  ORF type:complete len:577 (+),score=67.86 TRINITY_DN75354_c0_g1_i1:63-1793(+)
MASPDWRHRRANGSVPDDLTGLSRRKIKQPKRRRLQATTEWDDDDSANKSDEERLEHRPRVGTSKRSSLVWISKKPDVAAGTVVRDLSRIEPRPCDVTSKEVTPHRDEQGGGVFFSLKPPPRSPLLLRDDRVDKRPCETSKKPDGGECIVIRDSIPTGSRRRTRASGMAPKGWTAWPGKQKLFASRKHSAANKCMRSTCAVIGVCEICERAKREPWQHLASIEGRRALRSVHFEVRGTEVQLEILNSCKLHTVCVSEALAIHMAKNVAPSMCISLQRGRLKTVADPRRFCLCRRQVDADGKVSWILACERDGFTHFFNFILQLWQPFHFATLGAYAASVDYLYVGFRPESRGPRTGKLALFLKLGYRDTAKDIGAESFIRYVEKKTPQLKITNSPGAGLFYFPVPENHRGFSRPGRAAEASLKTLLLHSTDVLATPTGHRAEVGSFSASLEYFFIEAAAGADEVSELLENLTRVLRSFSGDDSLVPHCAVASAGLGIRSGPKRLKSVVLRRSSIWRGGRARARISVLPALANQGIALRSRWCRGLLSQQHSGKSKTTVIRRWSGRAAAPNRQSNPV